ncbi:MAG: hypothetical protein DMF10_06385 [Verrucomicrobia bacterium]|nr:MAG: hypothetical protein DMF10_06385 [Verrucomicrobiota bacterium]PYI47869.1 MAG: hypothetical protein DMF11_05120 [Verrucomicrobiota bacterium]
MPRCECNHEFLTTGRCHPERSRRIPRNQLLVSPRDSSTSLGMTVFEVGSQVNLPNFFSGAYTGN